MTKSVSLQNVIRMIDTLNDINISDKEIRREIRVRLGVKLGSREIREIRSSRDNVLSFVNLLTGTAGIKLAYGEKPE